MNCVMTYIPIKELKGLYHGYNCCLKGLLPWCGFEVWHQIYMLQ